MPDVINRIKAAKEAMKSGSLTQPSERNPFSLRQYPPGTRKVASFGLTLFVLGLGIAAAWAPRFWALSILCSSAFMAVGWGLGFLFGVPRTAATDTRTNTNLEQISDWLTKVLVGVGLTQLSRLPTKIGLLASYIATGYGDSASNVFALSMFLYFSSLGFLTGYLLTRLALQAEFDRAGGDGKTPTPGQEEPSKRPPQGPTQAPPTQTPTPTPEPTPTPPDPPTPA